MGFRRSWVRIPPARGGYRVSGPPGALCAKRLVLKSVFERANGFWRGSSGEPWGRFLLASNRSSCPAEVRVFRAKLENLGKTDPKFPRDPHLHQDPRSAARPLPLVVKIAGTPHSSHRPCRGIRDVLRLPRGPLLTETKPWIARKRSTDRPPQRHRESDLSEAIFRSAGALSPSTYDWVSTTLLREAGLRERGHTSDATQGVVSLSPLIGGRSCGDPRTKHHPRLLLSKNPRR